MAELVTFILSAAVGAARKRWHKSHKLVCVTDVVRICDVTTIGGWRYPADHSRLRECD